MKNKADERFNVCYSQVGEMLTFFVCMYMVDRGFDSQLGQTKDYEIAAIRSNSKDWLERSQDNVSEWSDISLYGVWYREPSL